MTLQAALRGYHLRERPITPTTCALEAEKTIQALHANMCNNPNFNPDPNSSQYPNPNTNLT